MDSSSGPPRPSTWAGPRARPPGPGGRKTPPGPGLFTEARYRPHGPGLLSPEAYKRQRSRLEDRLTAFHARQARESCPEPNAALWAVLRGLGARDLVPLVIDRATLLPAPERRSIPTRGLRSGGASDASDGTSVTPISPYIFLEGFFLCDRYRNDVQTVTSVTPSPARRRAAPVWLAHEGGMTETPITLPGTLCSRHGAVPWTSTTVMVDGRDWFLYCARCTPRPAPFLSEADVQTAADAFVSAPASDRRRVLEAAALALAAVVSFGLLAAAFGAGIALISRWLS